MHTRILQIAAIVLGAGVFACGGAGEEPVALEVGFADSALASNVGVIRVVAHNSPQATCQRVASFPDNQGYFREDIVLDDNQKQTGGSKTINSLAEGNYTVAIFGFADESASEVLAYGCEQNITISLGELSTIEITLEPVN